MKKYDDINTRTDIKLIEPTVELKSEFLEMAEECLSVDASTRFWDFKDAFADFNAYVKKWQDCAKGRNLPQGWVPSSEYWLVRGNWIILGCSSLRHRLTGALRKFGGHIGYFVRPSEKGKGYATKILALTLEKARELGIKRVLVTCDDDNIASARVIEKNGGKFENRVMNEGHKVPTRRYWIDLTWKKQE